MDASWRMRNLIARHRVGWAKARDVVTVPRLQSLRAPCPRVPSATCFPDRRVGTAPRTILLPDRHRARRLCPPYAACGGGSTRSLPLALNSLQPRPLIRLDCRRPWRSPPSARSPCASRHRVPAACSPKRKSAEMARLVRRTPVEFTTARMSPDSLSSTGAGTPAGATSALKAITSKPG